MQGGALVMIIKFYGSLFKAVEFGLVTARLVSRMSTFCSYLKMAD